MFAVITIYTFKMKCQFQTLMNPHEIMDKPIKCILPTNTFKLENATSYLQKVYLKRKLQ